MTQGVLVLRIEAQHFGERFVRAIDEPAALVVEPEAEQHVGVLQAAEPGALQQRLVHGDRLADLALLAVQVAEDHVHFERLGVQARGAGQFLDGEIDLIGDQKVQPEDVVGRLARAAAIDPFPAAQLVPLPRLADRQADQKRHQRREEQRVVAHVCACRAAPLALRRRSDRVGGNDGVPSILGAKNQLDQLAHRAAAAVGAG